MIKPVRKCSTEGCERVHYGRGYCSACYWKHSKAGDLKPAEEVNAVPPPPSPPPNKKRCHARMKDGTRCIRAIRAKGLCSAHWHEAMDREAFELREQPIESHSFEYRGCEDELIAALEKRP